MSTENQYSTQCLVKLDHYFYPNVEPLNCGQRAACGHAVTSHHVTCHGTEHVTPNQAYSKSNQAYSQPNRVPTIRLPQKYGNDVTQDDAEPSSCVCGAVVMATRPAKLGLPDF